MRSWLFLALSAMALPPVCALSQDKPPVPIPAPDIKQIASMDWIALLNEPATRRTIASLIRSILPVNLQERATEDQIDEALSKVAKDVQAIQAGLSQDETLLEIVKRIGNDLWPEEAQKIEKQVGDAIRSVRQYIKEENGKYVVNLERAGSLRLLYTEQRFRGPSTILKPINNTRHGYILISGDEITLALDGSRLEGRGDLVLQDRYGKFTADALRYDESQRLIKSDKLDLRLPSLKLSAATMSTDVTDIDMTGLRMRSTVAGIPAVTMLADTLATEGDWGTTTNFRINVLGIRVYSRNYWKFPVTRLDNQDPMPSLLDRLRKLGEMATYLKPPVIDFFGRAPAVTYTNSISFSNREQVSVGIRAQRGQYLASQGRFTYNLLNQTGSSPGIMTTRNLTSDFADGYVQNPGIRSMEDVINNMRRPRLTTVLDFAFNQRVELRGIEDIESIPLGIGVELGGPIGRFGAIGQIRFENARVVRVKSQNRLVAFGTLGLIQTPLSRGLQLNARIDGLAIKPQGKGYAWIRPVATLQARILPQLYISGSFVTGSEFGPAFMLGDRYLAGPEYHARIDVDLGPTQISYANRYSARRKSWYRSQLYVAQDIDAFQLFILSDQSLGRFSFGATLRIQEILEGLKGRRYTGVAIDPPAVRKL